MFTAGKIDVVGGSGFIGSCLVRRLSDHSQLQVRIIDKAPSFDFPQFVTVADVCSIDSLRTALSENSILVNLAAEHRDDVYPITRYDDVNIGGARNLCNVAREKNIQTIIFTSSVAVYGFAEVGTDESGAIAPFNDYGRTKYEAEIIFRAWQAEAPKRRTLVIIRPTVVFGERNRGNVYNMLRQIASKRFVMVGDGENRKSMAYVENVAGFIQHCMDFKPGIHVYNYIDKPDFNMNQLVGFVLVLLGRPASVGFRLPYWLGFFIGKGFDLVAAVFRKRLTISSIRVKKFCCNSVYSTSVDQSGYHPPVPLHEAIERTVRYEFITDGGNLPLRLFYSE
jgi:GlcNAc-P-P-Und epimerase